ncbi:MAG: 1,2-phenylacetyl-CoA epoxidase subunit PaaC [Chitinophagaceae bacterium]
MTQSIHTDLSNVLTPAGWTFLLHLADNVLILGQRNAEWCGHGPALEQDIAITNISLDLIGQARNFYQYAADSYNAMSAQEKTAVEYLLPRLWKGYNRNLEEDDLAFLREERQYLNLLITELPKGDWAQTVLRQFFYSAFQYQQYTDLLQAEDEQLAAIAAKSLKEVTYHLRWSSEWVIRLGDGTEESYARISNALNELWPFTGELFMQASYESRNASAYSEAWTQKVAAVFEEATLPAPASAGLGARLQKGGKEGIHTEYLGILLSEMQYLQRTYPNAVW